MKWKSPHFPTVTPWAEPRLRLFVTRSEVWLELLIKKIMVGKAHEWCGNAFAQDLLEKTIMIERWGHQPFVYPSHVVGGLNICTRMIQIVSVDMIGVVIGAPLLLPSDLIFDIGRIPQGVLPIDFSFDVQDLILLSTEFWRALN